ncbi:hypothetical protein J6590_027881 [Homalodisca vitripennis]|nr:hypothetical protein J6590_027881 [Homalodisca vitripennis]
MEGWRLCARILIDSGNMAYVLGPKDKDAESLMARQVTCLTPCRGPDSGQWRGSYVGHVAPIRLPHLTGPAGVFTLALGHSPLSESESAFTF